MNNTMKNELAENELDTVVGGSAWDWIKENAGTIGKTVVLTLPVSIPCGPIALGLITLGVATGIIKKDVIDETFSK